MRPILRNTTLTSHVSASVGWFGAVVTFLALAIAGLTSANDAIVRGSYIAMELTGWYVIVPFCLATVATGLIQSLTTNWGLFRHNWVVVKLVIAVIATILLTLHLRPVTEVAQVAAAATLSPSDLRPMRIQLIADAGLAAIALTIATALSVFKPQGLTPYGRRVYADGAIAEETLAWSYVWAIGALLLALLFAFVHLAGMGLHAHH